MRLYLKAILILASIATGWCAAGQPAQTQPSTPDDHFRVIAGHIGTAPNWSPALRLRPRSQDDNGLGLVVDSVLIHSVVNSDGLHLDGRYGAWSYSSVTLRNVEVGRIWRDINGARAGLHVDLVQIREGTPNTPLAFRTVRLWRGLIPDGVTPADTCLIEGAWKSILFDAVQVDGGGSIKIKPGGSNRVPMVTVQNSPGLRLTVWPGVGSVTLVNSPGAVVSPVEGASPVIIEDSIDWRTEYLAAKAAADALRERQHRIEQWIAGMPQ